MKRKSLILVCLLSGIWLMRLSAQTSVWVEAIVDNTFDIPIICNGEEVDVLNFPLFFELRIIEHMKKERVKTHLRFRKARRTDIDKGLRETFTARIMTNH